MNARYPCIIKIIYRYSLTFTTIQTDIPPLRLLIYLIRKIHHVFLSIFLNH